MKFRLVIYSIILSLFIPMMTINAEETVFKPWPGPNPNVITVGTEPGLTQIKVPVDQILDLWVNSTNDNLDIPVYEWLLYTYIVDENQLPIYLMSDIGTANLQDISNLYFYTYTYDPSNLTFLVKLSLSSMGLTSGDSFIYAYAYQNKNDVIILENVVSITAE